MKRRDFLSAPVALVGLGFAAGGSKVAQAAGVSSGTITPGSTSFSVLRLVGSALETEAFGGWQAAWPQVAALTRARVVVHGYVRGTANTLGAVDIESVFFNEGKVNTALVYAVSAQAAGSGSGQVGFHVRSPNFAGFSITPRSSGAGRKGKAVDAMTVSLGDAGGRLAPGLYVMLLEGGKPVDASQLVFTGYNERPLVLRNGTAPDRDYLAFSVEEA